MRNVLMPLKMESFRSAACELPKAFVLSIYSFLVHSFCTHVFSAGERSTHPRFKLPFWSAY